MNHLWKGSDSSRIRRKLSQSSGGNTRTRCLGYISLLPHLL